MDEMSFQCNGDLMLPVETRPFLMDCGEGLSISKQMDKLRLVLRNTYDIITTASY